MTRLSTPIAPFALAALFASALATLAYAQAETSVASGSTTTLQGQAGGASHATRYGVTNDGVCTGWIAETPDHVIVLDDALDGLTVRVSSPSDTTLVILGPGETRRCADDGDGPNPVITGAWAAGRYEIYVGSYARNETAPYTLELVAD